MTLVHGIGVLQSSTMVQKPASYQTGIIIHITTKDKGPAGLGIVHIHRKRQFLPQTVYRWERQRMGEREYCCSQFTNATQRVNCRVGNWTQISSFPDQCLNTVALFRGVGGKDDSTMLLCTFKKNKDKASLASSELDVLNSFSFNQR